MSEYKPNEMGEWSGDPGLWDRVKIVARYVGAGVLCLPVVVALLFMSVGSCGAAVQWWGQ
jgi:hypothetical protein